MCPDSTWIETHSDEYSFTYDELITYLADGISTQQITKLGDGNTVWSVDKRRDYAWDQYATDGSYTQDLIFDDECWDAIALGLGSGL